jgi:hypothetical protein
MGKIVNLQDFILERTFTNSVIPFFTGFNPYFNHYKEGDEAVFLIQTDMFLFIFLKFIPKNEPTKLPTIQQCFEKITFQSRISDGEWVVEGVHELENTAAKELLNDCKSIENSDVYAFLKKHVKK